MRRKGEGKEIRKKNYALEKKKKKKKASKNKICTFYLGQKKYELKGKGGS